MKRSFLAASVCLFALNLNAASAGQSKPVQTLAQSATAPPVAGEVPMEMTVVEMESVVNGWSAKKNILGKTVRNDKKEPLGTIDDVIITSKDLASYAIISVGGFLGIDQRRIAVPMRKLKWEKGQFELPGATKDVLKAMPPFIYAH